MQAPAIGRALANELILHQRYQILDWSRRRYQRILDAVPLHDDVPEV